MSARRWPRPTPVVLLAAALAIPAIPATATGAPAGNTPDTGQTITYHGYRFHAPAGWPVVDLDRDPSACVRFDVHAVYLGHPGADQNCPPHLIDRTEALLVEPLDQQSRPRVTSRTVQVDSAAPGSALPGTGDAGELTVAVKDAGVLVTASYGTDAGEIRRLVAGGASGRYAGSGAGSTSAEPAGTDPPDPDPVASVAAPGSFTGQGFDACAAPSAATMNAWRASPYRGLGVYIGGVARACAQPNLTTSWVATQVRNGWHLIPIYVGLQAPCTKFRSRIDPNQAAAQGIAAADDASSHANGLGLAGNSVLYFDMEAYNHGDAGCRNAVLTFLSNWTVRLHNHGYRSAVYSSVTSGIADLVSVYNTGGYTRPDHIWFARWDGGAGTADGAIPGGCWSGHQRVKQFKGDHNESYGGTTINIDSDYLDVT